MSFSILAKEVLQMDQIKTSSGNLEITFIGHGSLLFQFNHKNIFIDPYSKIADYSQMPKADFIFITHEHPDHFDLNAIAAIKTDKTKLIMTKNVFDSFKSGIVMKNGDVQNFEGIKVEALPAYNII